MGVFYFLQNVIIFNMKNISVNLFKEIIEKEGSNPSVAFINVCTPVEYAEKHIKGVESMPLDTIEKNIDKLKVKKTIYVHCMSGARAERAIEIMEDHGINSEVINIEGGLMAWVSAGFPTISKRSFKISVMRQVFLISGLLVLLGIILALITRNLNFLYLSGFVGLGLTFSGLTGWCGLHYVISKMPWNKVGKC